MTRLHLPLLRSRDSGVGLVVVLSVLMPLIVVTGSLLLVLTSHQEEVEQRVGQTQARSLSTSGVHHAMTWLSQNPGYTGTYEASLPGGAVRVTVADWSADGLDNDGVNGADDAAEDGIVAVDAEGWVNPPFATEPDPLLGTKGGGTDVDPKVARPIRRYQATTRILAKADELDLTVSQAVYVDDPLATLDINGNSFLFSGYDLQLDGTPDPDGAVVPGIGVPGDPSYLISQIANNQYDNIVGTGGLPSVQTVAAADLSQTVQLLAGQADVVWTTDASYSGALGDTSAPVICHAQGDLSLTGNTTGAGILIVDGNLKVGGAFDYKGIILCQQSVEFLGGGNKTVLGALLCLGSLAANISVEVSGNVTIAYSSDAVTVATNAAVLTGSYSVIAWLPE